MVAALFSPAFAVASKRAKGSVIPVSMNDAQDVTLAPTQTRTQQRRQMMFSCNAQLRSAIRVIFQIETAGREPVYTEVL